MSHAMDHATLMRFLDGELDDEERRRVEEHLASCTECRREVAVYRSIGEDLSGGGSREHGRPGRGTVETGGTWQAVDRRLTRPAGWALIAVGALFWLAWGVWSFVTSPGVPIEKLATGALLIGFAVLLASLGLERWRDWKREPYRDVER